MIKKNTDGNEIFAELKGFRQFIKTAEERKLETLIKESPSYFESTMAYALTFGALGAWAKKFEGLDIKPPDWYHSHSGSFHSMNSFSNSFSKTITSTSSTMVSTPSSSGSGGSSGGSSGGGFGGGGGGSYQQGGPQGGAPRQQPPAQQQPAAQQGPGEEFSQGPDFDDDIPF